MKCVITKASTTLINNSQPHPQAYWDENIMDWCIDIDTMDQLRTIIKTIPYRCITNAPQVILSLYHDEIHIEVYDDYIE